MSTLSLPSRIAPSSRSRSAGRLGREESGDGTRVRSPLPSTPRMPSSRSIRPEGYLSRDKPDTTRTNSSSTTTSTSGSSFLDRINAPSSRTSLEDEQSEPPRRGRGGWASYRGKKAVQAKDEQSDEEDRNESPTALIAGHGADLWGRVTAVASQLTVNVSHAWQYSILADGEETPPGEESRLTKAMKAYHLDRARSAVDLPPWLFTEQERGMAPKAWNASHPREYEDRFLPDREPEPPQRGGLREVYDLAAASSSIPPATRRPPAEFGDGGGSRAANRLKAIRDAKRSAKTASEPAQVRSEDRRGDERDPVSKDSGTRRGGQRVGLPARPSGIRRE